MKLKLLLLALLLPFSAFGANTNAFDNVLIKNALQLRMGTPVAGKFWIATDSLGYGAWGQDGASLTNLNASSLASGTVPYARLPSNTATNIVGIGPIVITVGSGVYTNSYDGSIVHNDSGATNLNASNLASGTVPYARLPTGTATNVTGSGGIVITEPTPGTWNVDGSGISGGGGSGTNVFTVVARNSMTSGSAFTFATMTNATTSLSTGLVVATASFMTAASANAIVFIRIHGGGRTNIANFTQAAAQSNPIVGQVAVSAAYTSNITFTADLWTSTGSQALTNHVNAGATYPAMDSFMGITLMERR